LKNFSLKFKLLSLSVFLVLISGVIGGVAYWSTNEVTKDYNVVTNSIPRISNMLQVAANFRLSRIEVLHLASPSASAELKNASVSNLEKTLAADKELHDKYMAIEFLPNEQELYSNYRKTIDQMNALFNKALELHKKGDPASFSELTDILYVQIPPIGEENISALNALRDFHHEAADRATNEAKETGAFANMLIIVIGLGLGSIGLIASFIFSGTLSKTLSQISDALDQSSSQVSSAASQIASSSEELSQAATEQAASLQETSSSVEEMSSMVNINFENSKKASENSQMSKKQAERGQVVVQEMVSAMAKIDVSNNNIMEQINYSNDQMAEIVKVIQEIGTKTKVINDIVFQTKLLSFNASVEAARAGEQGKGFAVVAEEVGNLAQMSGNAAKEISEMLAASVNKVESIVNETKTKVDVLVADGREKVKAGAKVAEECGQVLAEIVSNVANVSTMAGEITNASDEQSKGIQEITKAMGQLDQVTQTNSATSQETASAAEELSAQANSLKNQVLTLVSVINGAAVPVKVSSNLPKSSASAQKKDKVSDHSNVVHIKKSEKPAPALESAPTPAKEAVKAKTTEVKKIVGGRDSVPSYDHPGFEDV
jgi:methyl-accepting chemotaxis protein